MAFKDKYVQEQVARDNNFVIMGKQVQVKIALTKEQTRLKLLEEKKRKLFIINLSEKITKGKNSKLKF